MRIAALDLGSNTSLLLIADVTEGQIRQVLVDETEVTKMGEGVHAERKFASAALLRIRQCFERYRKLIETHRPDRVLAVATSAARDVSNFRELLSLGEEFQIPISIIEGQHEAELTYLGAMSNRPEAEGTVVVDVGGGSTEIIRREKGALVGRSVDIGSVRLTEMIGTSERLSARQLIDMKKIAADLLLPTARAAQQVVAVAGTPTTLTMLELGISFEESKIEGFCLTADKIQEWSERMAGMTTEERSGLPGMPPKRADVIVAGSVILLESLRALSVKEATVSTRGVRYGVAIKGSLE